MSECVQVFVIVIMCMCVYVYERVYGCVRVSKGMYVCSVSVINSEPVKCV